MTGSRCARSARRSSCGADGTSMTHSRREVLAAAAGTVFASVLLPLRATAIPQLRVTGIELLSVRATSRTVWLIVRLRTDGGLERLGEASDAFGFANTTAEDTARIRAQLAAFFNLIDGRSPFEIESPTGSAAKRWRARGSSPRPHSAPSSRRCGTWPAKHSTCRRMSCSEARSGTLFPSTPTLVRSMLQELGSPGHQPGMLRFRHCFSAPGAAAP